MIPTIQMPLRDLTGGGGPGGAIVDPHAADNPTTVVPGAPVAGGTAPEFKITDDENIVETRGHKYVREEALAAERARASEAINTLNTLQPMMGEFEEFLQSKQNARTATVSRATRTVPQDSTDYTDDELQGFAIVRGYYTEHNGARVPDVRRAKDELDIMSAVADRRAARQVGPVAALTQRDRATQNLTRVASQQFTDGDPIAEPQYVNAVFEAVPENLRADPQTANLLAVVAAGLQALDQRHNGGRRGSNVGPGGPGRREPVFREGGGGRVAAAEDTLDALDRAAARARGRTPEQWSKISKAVSGQSIGGSVLEDV